MLSSLTNRLSHLTLPRTSRYRVESVLFLFQIAIITGCFVSLSMQQQEARGPGRAPVPVSGPVDSAAGQLATANSAFAFNLYNQLGKGSSDNIFFSPGSISVAMAMTYLGARGNTATEMKQGLMFGDVADAELHGSFNELLAAYQKTENITLHMANRLYADKSFKIMDSYLADSKKHYSAELAQVDFLKETEAARKLINQWVEDQTATRIKDILPSGAIDALTRAVLVNAIYFKGDWNNKFDKADTKDGEFTTLGGEKLKVQLMYQRKKFMFGLNRDLHAQAIELPYAGLNMSMILVLPEAGQFELCENNIKSDDIVNIEKTFRMNQMDVHVHLPRFKMEDSFSLAPHLAELGIRDLFDDAKADLSGLDSANSVFVSKVLHKSFLEVNEEGSEAAAATAVVMMLRAMPREFHFKADRPFMFFIRENTTRSILFMGRLMKPAADSGKDELTCDCSETLKDIPGTPKLIKKAHTSYIDQSDDNADIAAKLQDLISLSRNLCERCEKLNHIPGAHKLLKKCQAEFSFLNKLKEKKNVRDCHLNSTNLGNLRGVLEAVESLPNVSHVLQSFPSPHANQPIVVDVVCNYGYTWVKVIARKAQALQRVWVGEGQFGERNIVTQGEMYTQCADDFPVCFKSPQVIFVFTSGITAPLTDALQTAGITVVGRQVEVQNAMVEEQSGESGDESDQSDLDIPTASELFNKKLNLANDEPCDKIKELDHTQSDTNSSSGPLKCDTSQQMSPCDEIAASTVDLYHEICSSTFCDSSTIDLVNLDITSLIALVSNLCHGHCWFTFREPILTNQAEWERERPQFDKLQRFLEGKELCVCETALKDFHSILETVGGPNEKTRAQKLLSRVKVVPDELSQRSEVMELSAKVKHRAKVIFGTGDHLRAVTMTANSGFIRAAANQGVNFAVYIHESRALTENKEATATKIKPLETIHDCSSQACY